MLLKITEDPKGLLFMENDYFSIQKTKVRARSGIILDCASLLSVWLRSRQLILIRASVFTQLQDVLGERG